MEAEFNKEGLPEKSNIDLQGIQIHLSELRQQSKTEAKITVSKDQLLDHALNNMPIFDYLYTMERKAPEIQAGMLQIGETSTDSVAFKVVEGNESRDKLKEESAEQKKQPKILDIKSKYKIIFVELIISVFKTIGYPIVWMKGHFYIYNGAYYLIIPDENEFIKFLREAGERSGIPWDTIKNIDFLKKAVEQFISVAYVSKREDEKRTY